MTKCNVAFVELSERVEDLLSASFEESPRGDKNRVGNVANNLLMLLANSFYSITWLNAKFANETTPGGIDPQNTKLVEAVTQAATLKISFNKAIQSYVTWAINKKFQSCRLCDECGGDYPSYGGEGYTDPEVGWWERYSGQCAGNVYNTNNIPKLCCSADEPPC
jgi:hypothetical protein